jgi:hypothetical protein
LLGSPGVWVFGGGEGGHCCVGDGRGVEWCWSFGWRIWLALRCVATYVPGSNMVVGLGGLLFARFTETDHVWGGTPTFVRLVARLSMLSLDDKETWEQCQLRIVFSRENWASEDSVSQVVNRSGFENTLHSSSTIRYRDASHTPTIQRN